MTVTKKYSYSKIQFHSTVRDDAVQRFFDMFTVGKLCGCVYLVSSAVQANSFKRSLVVMSVVQRDTYNMLSICIINHKIDRPTIRFTITCTI
jgi:hypothetical protein